MEFPKGLPSTIASRHWTTGAWITAPTVDSGHQHIEEPGTSAGWALAYASGRSSEKVRKSCGMCLQGCLAYAGFMRRSSIVEEFAERFLKIAETELKKRFIRPWWKTQEIRQEIRRYDETAVDQLVCLNDALPGKLAGEGKERMAEAKKLICKWLRQAEVEMGFRKKPQRKKKLRKITNKMIREAMEHLASGESIPKELRERINLEEIEVAEKITLEATR